MSNHNSFLAPIAVDFGAKNTGVFRACYARGTHFRDISSREGEVLILSKDKYTIMLKDRTAKRHMRRGFDRRKMAMRLLIQVLEGSFQFPASAHRQALGFFLNRRGFTRLEETFDAKLFRQFPQEAWDVLPDTVKNQLKSCANLHDQFNKLLNEDSEQFKPLDDAISQALSPYRQAKTAYGYANKVMDGIKTRLQGLPIKEKKNEGNKLSRMPEFVLDTWQKAGVNNPPEWQASQGRFDMLSWLNEAETDTFGQLQTDMQKVSQTLEQDSKHLFASINTTSFDLGKNADALNDVEHRDHTKAHLYHLCFAIHQIAEELRSGGRHRRKYFIEVHDDLAQIRQHPHRYMQCLGEAFEAHGRLDADKLCRIICHISNLELKPLRTYFNDQSHKQGDQWHPERLAKIVSRWFLKSWRVNAEKDGEAKVEAYHALLNAWRKHLPQTDMVQFWLNADPELTIPPYQSQANRRPPDCQSLVLNVDYLDRHYKVWREWLTLLVAQQRSVPDLGHIMSSKGKPLVDDKESSARQLQFLLDRAKKNDLLRLNDIWSHYHRMQKYDSGSDEYQNAEAAMRKAIANSQLPQKMINDLVFNKKGSFGHFLNKYYQNRRRARDERLFFHPRGKDKTKRTTKWHDEHSIMTLCPHRPRQKKHQLTLDIAGILGLHHIELETKLGVASPVDFLGDITGFKTNAAKAAKAQKDYRGSLKEKLFRGEPELVKLVRRIERLADELVNHLWPELTSEERQQRASRFNNIFSFAQIHNIVFKDRSGFSRTCPVCSADNGARMQRDVDDHALASRLPALSIRLIDGAVMRLAEHNANEIAKRHWQMILPRLAAGTKVTVPLIMEENRFEFEPELAKIKRKAIKKQAARDDEQEFCEKENRIRTAALRLCAYFDKPLGSDGELDHIIPRASRYGTLNDEANLICVSRAANQRKTNQSYYLKDLHAAYKQSQFGSTDDAAIREHIYETLVGIKPYEALPSRFVFGDYLSFINLDENQRTAMRHALFLADDDPLKQMVIRALQNRNRTFVNGTQRFLAQQIADKLYARARKAGYAQRLSFDYFEYPANPYHPLSTQGLRHELQGLDQIKSKGDRQESYSHFVDAQMAFLLAAEDHKNDGSMGITFREGQTIWPIDKETGEIRPDDVYQNIRIDREDVPSVPLERKSAINGVRTHRPFHRDNFYADRYFPLWVADAGEKPETRFGFSWKNSASMVKSKHQQLLRAVALFARDTQWQTMAQDSGDWLAFCHAVIEKTGGNPVCITWNRRAIHLHCTAHHSTATLVNSKDYADEVVLMRELAYQTQKMTITEPNEIYEILGNKKKWKKNKITLPCKQEWDALAKAWEAHQKPEGEEFHSFLREYFLGDRSRDSVNQHRKVRKVFSLPTLNENAHYMQQRRTLAGEDVWQLVADSDSRKDGNKFLRLARTDDGECVKVINSAFISKRMFKLEWRKNDLPSDVGIRDIDPNRWWRAPADALPEGVTEMEFRLDNVTRPKVRLKIANAEKISFDHPLLKPKEKAKVQKEVEDGLTLLEYALSGYSKPIRNLLRTIFKASD